MSELTKVVDNTLPVEPDVTDPKFTYTNWDNMVPSDWTATRQDCHQFGEITVITHDRVPTLKLFIAKEIAAIFGYSNRHKLAELVINDSKSKVPNSGVLKKDNQIKDLDQILEDVGSSVPNRGLSIINYAGFNHAMMRSELPNAKLIQSWIYGNVMPKIAETGSYSIDKEKVLDQYTNDIKTYIDNKINKLLTYQTIKDGEYSYQDLVDYINENYSDGRLTDIDKIKNILRKMKIIKKNNEPFDQYVKNEMVIWNMDVFNPNEELKFTKKGFQYIIEYLLSRGLGSK